MARLPRIFGLVASRSLHAAVNHSVVVVKIAIDIGHEAHGVVEVLEHIVFIVVGELAIVQFIAA